MKKTVAITPSDYIKFGCPCCCGFVVKFGGIAFGTRVVSCKKTSTTFHIVITGRKSAITGSQGETVKVIKHPLGQLS